MSVDTTEEQVAGMNAVADADGDNATPAMQRLAKSRFLIMIISSIAIALVLVMVSMAMYANSGAAQVDLSRPGYQSVRNQIRQDNIFDGFSASGSIDDKTLESFKKTYGQRTKNATSVDNAFNSEVLADQALGIDDVPAVPAD